MSRQGCEVSYRLVEKLLNGGANKNAFMPESRDIRKIFRRYARLPAEDRGTRTAESRVGLGVRWEMAVGGHTPSRKLGALNFLWNLLTIKYEPVRSVILNFRMCPPGSVIFLFGSRVPSVPLSRRIRGRGDVENVVRGIYQSSSSTRYLIFMKDSGRRTRSRRKTLGRRRWLRRLSSAMQKDWIPEEKVLTMEENDFKV